MQPDERNAAYIWDMLEAAREVIACTRGVSFEHFMANRVLMRATERSVEIIGEAARHVSPEFIAAHPQIPWRQIIGMEAPPLPPLTAKGSLRSSGAPTGVPLAGKKGDRGGFSYSASLKSPLPPMSVR